ncbi:MAG: aldo/keto reductase [Armatimonadota bacterium]
MSKLGFGLMRLPVTVEGDPKSIDQELVNKMVDYYLEKGFTYFDTAYPYHQGMSEVAARKAIVERHPRESFTLADKMPTFFVTSGADYQRFFDEQLERCGVQYFDYYLLHTLGARLYAGTLEYGGFDFMKKLKAEGKAKHIGFSYHDKAELLDRILTEHPEMEFVQLQINYIDWDNTSIESRKCYDVATKHNKPVIVMEPVKGGSLTHLPAEANKMFRAYHPDMSAASWAIRFAASLDNVFMVLSGMSSFEQVVDNTSYMQDMALLNDEEKEIIKKATAIINSSIAIPCTACQYCVDGCPQKIPISKYFSLYNDQNRFKLVPAHMNYYTNLAHDFGKASDCIGCKQCEEHCPQKIDIVEQLKEVAKVFDVSR